MTTCDALCEPVMMELLFLSGMVLLHLSLASSGGQLNVAPADFDSTCAQHASSYRPTEKILLDTQYYTSQSLIDVHGDSKKWLSLDLDGTMGTSLTKWSDQSQSLTCQHNMLVCGYSDGLQENWMVTQYINISRMGVTELVLNITFFATTGSECIGACSESLGIRMYVTNGLDEEGRNDTGGYSANLASLVHTQGGTAQELSSHKIPMSDSYTGLYLALVDPQPGNCVGITRIALFYYVCPEQELNLVKYPEVVAPTSMHVDDIVVPAVCSENAVLTSLSVSVECKYRGKWDSNNVVCECVEGYFFNKSSASCEACSSGYYKAGIGNSPDCFSCPHNSSAESPAASECSCTTGHYRTFIETASDPCTAPPGPPLNLVTTEITFANATLTWDQPSNLGGRTEIAYTITYGGIVISDIGSTRYTLTYLAPDTEYAVSVTAINDVSDQDNSPAASTATTNFVTLPVPAGVMTSKPVNVALMIGWEKPADVYGRIITYQLLVADTNDSAQANVYNTTHTNYDLSELNLRPGRHYMWTRAVTTTGTGELSNSISYYAGAEPENVTAASLTMMISGLTLGVLALVATVILIAIGIYYYKKRKRTYNIKHAEHNTYQVNNANHHQDL